MSLKYNLKYFAHINICLMWFLIILFSETFKENISVSCYSDCKISTIPFGGELFSLFFKVTHCLIGSYCVTIRAFQFLFEWHCLFRSIFYPNINVCRSIISNELSQLCCTKMQAFPKNLWTGHYFRNVRNSLKIEQGKKHSP